MKNKKTNKPADSLQPEQMTLLSDCPEFQKILAEDPILADLSRSEINKADEFISVMEMLGAPLTIGNIPIQPITPALWAFLWSIENHFTVDRKNITNADTDQFFYLLTHGIRDLDMSLSELVVKSSGCVTTFGLTYDFVAAELLDLIRLSFRPVEYIPYSQSEQDSDSEVSFNADWLATITSIAARMAGVSYREVMFNMPLSSCYFFYLEKLRELGNKGIYRKNSGDCIKQIVERTEELAKIYIKEHNLEK